VCGIGVEEGEVGEGVDCSAGGGGDGGVGEGGYEAAACCPSFVLQRGLRRSLWMGSWEGSKVK
jgi:hypothetical protein